MKNSEDFIKLTNRLQKLFVKRDNSYTLCVILGGVECELLRFINSIDREMTMKEIAEKFNISNAKVTRVLNTLVKKKFVERFYSKTDRRCWYARITAEGKQMAENTKYKLNQFQKEVLKKIPQTEIDKIYKYLKEFTDAYEQTINESEIE